MIFLYDRVENIVGKGENAGYQHFSPFPTMFSKGFLPDKKKPGVVWERVKVVHDVTIFNVYLGEFKNHGGSGGVNAEPGGPGSIYLHRIPDRVDGQIPDHFSDNRTLLFDNNNYEPRDPLRNLTDTYSDYATASGVGWIEPGLYPAGVDIASPIENALQNIVLDYLKVRKLVGQDYLDSSLALCDLFKILTLVSHWLCVIYLKS